jgi:hypothetical protein
LNVTITIFKKASNVEVTSCSIFLEWTIGATGLQRQRGQLNMVDVVIVLKFMAVVGMK